MKGFHLQMIKTVTSSHSHSCRCNCFVCLFVCTRLFAGSEIRFLKSRCPVSLSGVHCQSSVWYLKQEFINILQLDFQEPQLKCETHNCESVLKIAERGLTRLEDPCLLTPFPRFTLRDAPRESDVLRAAPALRQASHPGGGQVEVYLGGGGSSRGLKCVGSQCTQIWPGATQRHSGPNSRLTLPATPRPPPQMPTHTSLVYTPPPRWETCGNIWSRNLPTRLRTWSLPSPTPTLLLCPICQSLETKVQPRLESGAAEGFAGARK